MVENTIETNHKFGQTLEFKIKPIPQDAEPVWWVNINNNNKGVVERATEELEHSDQVGLTFCTNDFARDQGEMRLQQASEVTFNGLWEQISSIYQSNLSSLYTEKFCLGVTNRRLLEGRGYHNSTRKNIFEKNFSKRKCIITK